MVSHLYPHPLQPLAVISFPQSIFFSTFLYLSRQPRMVRNTNNQSCPCFSDTKCLYILPERLHCFIKWWQCLFKWLQCSLFASTISCFKSARCCQHRQFSICNVVSMEPKTWGGSSPVWRYWSCGTFVLVRRIKGFCRWGYKPRPAAAVCVLRWLAVPFLPLERNVIICNPCSLLVCLWRSSFHEALHWRMWLRGSSLLHSPSMTCTTYF